MTTIVKLGPADHGRPMTLEEFHAGDYQEGYQYELIDGKLIYPPFTIHPRLASFRGRWRRRLREVIEYLALHAFDLSPVTSRNKGQLLGPTADPQPG